MTHFHYGPPAAPPCASPIAGAASPRPGPRRRRSNAEYRWTRPKLAAFIKALASGGTVAEAARAVGMSRQSAHRLRARLGPGPVLELWDEACRVGIAARVHKATHARAR
jgi:hypothetical protein